MKDTILKYPVGFQKILDKTKSTDFDQYSDSLTGSLLATLAATKPAGHFLELGTGSGISAAWILHGMDSDSTLISIDNDESLVTIAKQFLDEDQRVEFLVGNGADLINDTQPNTIDFIFADAWPGKYSQVEETLSLLKPGGIYLIDDMLPRESWPDGHADKANNLIEYLETRDDLLITKLSWSSGIILCTKAA